MLSDVNPRLFTFIGGDSGPWRITNVHTLLGEPIPEAKRLDLVAGAVADLSADAKWSLRGLTSNERYVTRPEKEQLVARQEGLDRSQATHAALIPIRKTSTWWAFTQDERRKIFEDTSRHIETGMKYLPAIARRLHHCRDLGENEPFDFLTWFEYAPSDAAAFDDLLAALRATEEWRYVDREIDIRVVRE